MNDRRHEGTWLYGVIPAGAKLEEFARRKDRLPADVRVVEVGDLGIIVGNAPGEDPKATRDQVLAHARVLESAVIDAPVVPFRFGTVLSEGSLDTALSETWRGQLRQLLESVKDYVQLTLKASYREDVVVREIVETYPEIAQLREQTRNQDEMATRDIRVRLGELVGLALEQFRQHDASVILARMNPLAVQSRAEPLESEYMVLNAPFLVERRRSTEFEQAAAALADEQMGRMTLTLVGPLPAFDFIGGGQPPWE
jgi:hypothetical protein